MNANIMSMRSNIDHTFFNVGTGANISVLELANSIIDSSGLDLKPIYGPALKGDVRVTIADTNRIKTSLEWRSTISIQEWLKDKLTQK